MSFRVSDLVAQGIIQGSSAYANIFYDSANTAYYVDPASTSVLNGLTVGGSSVVTNNGGTWGISISGNAATATTASNSNQLEGLTINQIFNNRGNSHGTYNNFDSVSVFGPYFIQGSTNGPGTGSSQFYGISLGLGNDYAYSSYAMQMAIPRYNSSDKYLTYRTREAGSWGSWVKISAGYADSAGAVDFNNLTNKTGGTGTYQTSGDFRAPIFYDSANTNYYGDFASTSVMNSIRFGTSSNNSTLSGSGDWGTRFTTNDGWIQIGPANSSYAHIYTDRGSFYFNVSTLYANGSTVLHSSNYNSYSPTLTGGGASGTWGINITGTAATTSQTNFSNLTIGGAQVWYNSGGWLGDLASYGFTRAYGLQMSGGAEFVVLYKSGQGYTLVDGSYYAYEGGGFYSSNNSAGNTLLGFYADTTSSVNFNTGTVKANGSTLATQPWVQSQGYVTGGPYLPLSGGTLTGSLNISSGGAIDNQFTASGANGWRFIFASAANPEVFGVGAQGFGIYRNGLGDYHLKFDTSGNVTAPYSMRAPIFYDSQDTSFYGDFAGTSILNKLRLGNGAEVIDLLGMGASYYYGLGISSAYTTLYSHHSGNGVQLGYYNGTTFTPRLLVANGGDITLTSGTSGTTGKLIFKTSDNADLNKYIMQDGYWTVVGTHSNEGFRVRDSAGNILINVAGSTNGYPSKVGIGNTTPEYKLHVSGDIYANGGWLRVSGTSGLYFESYGGGWHMTESSYMRAYNGKSVHMNGGSVDYVGSLYLESGANNVHLQPNTGSYGSLQVTNSKNGWSGIRFTVSNVNIMANTNEVGFHNNGAGWQFLWSAGTAYVYKGGTGGGTQATVLDSSNYTSYAPSTTGSGASGTWGINITGNAGNTSSISNAVGSGYTWGGQQYFQSNLGGYSGSLSGPPLQAYSTGNNSAFMSFHKGGHYAVNMGLDADNVLRIGGWSASANRWELDMSGNNTVAGSFRAPIFYDSNNTGYYLDPDDTSNLWRFTQGTLDRHSLNSRQVNSPWGTRYAQGTLYQTGAMGWGQYDFNVIGSNWGSGFFDTWSNPGNAPGGSSHYVGMQAFHYNNSDSSKFHGWQMACAQEANNRWFWRSAWDTPRSWVEMIHSGNIGSQSVNYASSAGNADTVDGYHASGLWKLNEWNGNIYGHTDGRIYGTIFYDSNDSSYYCDPNSTSRFNAVGSFLLHNNYGVGTDHQFGISFNNVFDSAYAIFRESGAWSFPFPDLRIAFHTGIKLGANASYNGIRFYDDYNMATQVMSVNNSSDGLGANNVYVNNSLVAGSSLRAPIFYDSNDTTYYADFNNTGRSMYTAGYLQSDRVIMKGSSGGGQIYPTISYGGVSLYGGDQFTNGAYFTVTGIDYGSSPGAGSAEFVIRSTATSKFALFSYNGSTWTGRYGLFGSTGNVTIGDANTDIGYRLYVIGDIYATGNIIAYSDARVKTNVREIENPLARVLNTRGVMYDRTDNEEKDSVGFIAQELEKEFPELVSTSTDGRKGVKYQNMVAVLIEAMKEQNKEIQKLKLLINGTSN